LLPTIGTSGVLSRWLEALAAWALWLWVVLVLAALLAAWGRRRDPERSQRLRCSA